MTTKELLTKWKEIADKNKREYSEEELVFIKVHSKLIKALLELEFGKNNANKLEVTINYKE